MYIDIARPEIEERLLVALEASDKLVFLVGPRGSGKTALLRRLCRELERARSVALVQIEPIAASPEILCERFLELAKGVLADMSEGSPSFDHLLNSLSRARADAVLLLDELTELRTLSYFPGVEKPFESFLNALTREHAPQCVATSRFAFWLKAHLEKALASVSTRIEIVPLPPVSASELAAAGADEPELLTALTGGLPFHITPLLDRTKQGEDLTGALVKELQPGGVIEAECRATLGELLHRARGYGACKAVLSILASEDNLTLSEVARQMRRTAGSTRDYLRWLEEVDLITAREKRFSISDPLVRLWLRLYSRGAPPTGQDIRHEVESYVMQIDSSMAEPTAARDAATVGHRSASDELIEID